jgi:uncharacterized protein DUF6748
MKKLVLAALPLFSLVPACSSSGVFDELAGESPDDDIIEGKGDVAVDGTFTYFSISADMRKCASPACGGYFLSRLNRTTTTCVDHSVDASCYAPVLDWSETNLVSTEQDKLVDAARRTTAAAPVAVVRGRFAPTNSGPQPQLGRFIVTEAWVSESDAAPHGVFVKVEDAGIRCITAPCESLVERALNTSRSALIAEVDYAEAGLTDRQVEGFHDALFSPSGIIVAGDRFTVDGRAKGRTASSAFKRLQNPVAAQCFVGGCSSQICSDQEGVISTCEARPEYACYKTATCERQADGQCGWTATPELDACLGH